MKYFKKANAWFTSKSTKRYSVRANSAQKKKQLHTAKLYLFAEITNESGIYNIYLQKCKHVKLWFNTIKCNSEDLQRCFTFYTLINSVQFTVQIGSLADKEFIF